MLSAPATIPATIVATFPAGLDPTEPCTLTHICPI
jgi:hypothetical protein